MSDDAAHAAATEASATPSAAASASASAAAPDADSNNSRASFYRTLLRDLSSQLRSAPSRDPFSLLSNAAALIYHSYRSRFGDQSVNWSGFYLLRQARSAPDAAPQPVLLLGPFHGLPAVSLIRVGKGVCGSAVEQRATQLVPDVHAHPNHIACDAASAAELVVPLYAAIAGKENEIVGVMDLDSPTLGFFGEADARAMEQFAAMLATHVDWSMLQTPIDVNMPEDDMCPATRARMKKQAASAAGAGIASTEAAQHG